jgi:hypothetical protein
MTRRSRYAREVHERAVWKVFEHKEERKMRVWFT